MNKDIQQSTLAFLLNENEDQILLAMKKRGFGKGKWNGVGGKLEPEMGDKNVVDSLMRETKEEIGVELERIEKMAFLRFRFPNVSRDWDQDVHVFFAKSWWGEPRESEEMKPFWFNIYNLPYEKMWDDDKIWMPHVFKGRKLEGRFIFKDEERIEDHELKLVDHYGKPLDEDLPPKTNLA